MNQVLCIHVSPGYLSARTWQSVCSFVAVHQCVPYPRTGVRAGEIGNGRNTGDREGLTLSGSLQALLFPLRLQTERNERGV